jgi:hypothetical protein
VTLLGHFQSDLGRLELHHDGEQFDTRSTYVDAVCGAQRVSVVFLSAERAAEWYALCERRGAVFADFPEPSPQDAAPERTTA